MAIATPKIAELIFSFLVLANHTSGLPHNPTNWKANLSENKKNYRTYKEEDLLEYLAEEMILLDTPGEDYQYSNLGMGILGYSLTSLYTKKIKWLVASS